MKFIALLSLLLSLPAFAGVDQLSEKEFRQLAAELAPKVNLFRDVWEQDPKAEIYGGTSRDYLLWLKGQFREAGTAAQAQKIAKELRARSVIDVREFLIKASDVDIISEKRPDIDASRYDVKNVDSQRPEIFDPKSERGLDERRQGHLPAEKIRIGRGGILENPGMGDGAQEIYTGRLTAQFTSAEDFAKTAYAKQKLNHPVLLALRYLRLQAMNYFQEHGAEAPRLPKDVLRGLEPASAKQVKAAIQAAMAGGSLEDYLKKPRFVNWVNGSIQKSFRSYSNPTAAHMLLQEFGVDALATRYGDKIEPTNQFLFAKERDPIRIEKELKKAGLKPADLYSDPKDFFTDGFLYHGTKTEEAFRGILLQGVLPSTGGSADAGLYGVDKKNTKIAESFTGEKDLLVKFPVKPSAKIIDLRKEPGKSLAKKWARDLDGFAEAYGADILLYPYQKSYAFVVKNSDSLGKPMGVHREVMSLKDFAQKLKKSSKDALYKQLEAGLVADEEMLVGEELAERLGREKRSKEILEDFRTHSLPAGYRRSLATLILETQIPLPDAKEFLNVLSEANMTSTDKRAAIERAGLPEEKLAAALRSIPGDQAQFASQIELFAESKYAKAGDLVSHWIDRAAYNWPAMLTLARNLPVSIQSESKAWGEKLREAVFHLSESGDFGKKELADLAATGIWDRAPALHDELLRQLADKDMKSAEHFASSYLNSFDHPGAWKGRMPLFRYFLDKDRFSTTDLLKDALYHADELYDHPDMFLDLAARASSYDMRYHLDPGSKWMKIPLVKKIVGTSEYHRDSRNIEERWRNYKKEIFLKTGWKAIAKDPLALMKQMSNFLFDEEEAKNLLKKAPVSESEWLALLEKEGPLREKQYFAEYFLPHYPSARARDWLVNYYQKGDPANKGNAEHLVKSLLYKNEVWQEAFPDTTIDFLLKIGSIDGDNLYSSMVDHGFFKRHPEQLKRVFQSGDPHFYSRVLTTLSFHPEKLELVPTALKEVTDGLSTLRAEDREDILKRLGHLLDKPEFPGRKELKELLLRAQKPAASGTCAGKFAGLR